MSRPVSGFARTVLVDAHQRVLKRGRNFSRLQPVELHRLRIAAKKLRYAAEFFAPLYEERRTRNYRAALVRLHDGLGAFNDAATITTLAALACRDLKGPYVREARGIVLGWSAGMQDAGMQSIKRIWKEFRAASPFWE
jgi:CHAD domain-containing protein